MLSTVVIEVPQEVPTEVAAEASQRCQQVLGSGRCVLGAGSEEAGSTTYRAQVSIQGPNQSILRIVFVRGAPWPLLAERTLAFTRADAADSRWASVGLVVAGLVTEFDHRPVASPLSASAKPLRRSVLAPPPKPSVGIDVGVLTGPALERGPWRVGALVRGWYGLALNRRVLAMGGLRYSQRVGEPALRWASASLGIGSRFGAHGAPMNLDFVGEVVGERVMLSATQADAGRTESASQYRFGGRLGVSLAVRIASQLGVVAGAEASVLTPSVRVVVQDELVGRELSGRVAAWSGLRLSF